MITHAGAIGFISHNLYSSW